MDAYICLHSVGSKKEKQKAIFFFIFFFLLKYINKYIFFLFKVLRFWKVFLYKMKLCLRAMLIYIFTNGVWLLDPIVYSREAPGSKEKEFRRLGNVRFMVSDTGLIRAVSVGRFVPTQTKMESTQWHLIKNIRIEKSHKFHISPYMRSRPLNKFRVVNCSTAHFIHCKIVHLKVWRNEEPLFETQNGPLSLCEWVSML